MKTIGYARVSTNGQSVHAQLELLEAASCQPIFKETVSGAQAERKELRKALASLSAGDTLVVTRLDRLARSTRDLLEIVHQIETKGGRLRSLADTWADTTTPTGRLILTVLGGLAEFERSLIRERTAEGRARAKKAGRHLGRPSKLSLYQRNEAFEMRRRGQSNADIARLFGVHASTISRMR